jgi:SAM-dependent methyltransferase
MSAGDAYPERIVPDGTEPGIVAIHLKRYDFARPYCAGKVVLDAACGVGYGTQFLAAEAAHVVGVDLDPATVDYARTRYGAPNAEFAAGDVTGLPFADASFDVACSFETIEHVADPARALDELARVLRPDGLLAVSTPHVPRTNDSPANPHHRVELDRHDLEELLGARFSRVEIFGQRRLQTAGHRLAQRLDVLGLRRRVPALRGAARTLGTAPTAELTLDDLVISSERIELATELVALCREPVPRRL